MIWASGRKAQPDPDLVPSLRLAALRHRHQDRRYQGSPERDQRRAHHFRHLRRLLGHVHLFSCSLLPRSDRLRTSHFRSDHQERIAILGFGRLDRVCIALVHGRLDRIEQGLQLVRKHDFYRWSPHLDRYLHYLHPLPQGTQGTGLRVSLVESLQVGTDVARGQC